MKNQLAKTISFLTFLLLMVMSSTAQENIKYGEDFIVFEAEDTESDMTKWAVRKPGDTKYYPGGNPEAINQTYLEYTGPWAAGKNHGGDTELKYNFTCPKTGEYRLLMRMYQPLDDDEAGDAKNDVFVRLEGNYTSATNKTESDLQTNHKFWGRGVRKWGSCHKLEIGGAHFDARYGLVEGEEYTFYMAGRSGGASIDYILFYEDTPRKNIAIHDDIAITFPENYRPNAPSVTPTSLTITPENPTVRFESTTHLEISWEPANAQKDVEWSSSDESILTVDENGVVTAVGAVDQKATISAKSKVVDLTGSIDVSIVEWYPIYMESISLSPANQTIDIEATTTIIANFLPTNADSTSVLWTSSDDKIASVNANGAVTGHTEGTVTIGATSKADDTIFGEASVTVGEIIQPSVTFDDESKYLTNTYKNDASLDVTFDYHAGTGQTVTEMKLWLRQMTSDWQVVKDILVPITEYVGTTSGTASKSLSLDGATPTADLPAGDFYFLFVKCWYSGDATADKGIQPINIVAKNVAVTSITLDQTEVILNNIGDTHQLLSIVMPQDATNQEVTWSTSSAAIATVDDKGLITAIAEGNAIITATTADGSKTAEAKVTISIEKQSVLGLTESNGFKLWPNPAIRTFHLDVDNDLIDAYFQIFNTAGKAMLSGKLSSRKNEISLEGFSPGIYMIKVKNGLKGFSSKLIVR